ncbi:hypothetical protein K8S19_09745 [bacterium]|nr:hypothetical protein [bacterium]
MKKFLLLSLGLVLLLGAAKASFAATTAQVFIHVTITSGTVDITRVTGADIHFGQVLVATSAYTDGTQESQFNNSSTDVVEDFSLSASDTTGTWVYQTDAPGTAFGAIDLVRLSALWGATGVVPAPASFLADDTINGATLIESTADIFAITADAAALKGYAIPHATTGGNDRYIHFRLDTPNDGSAGQGVNVDITVTVTASIT